MSFQQQEQQKETEKLATRLVDKHKEVVDILEKYSEISDIIIPTTDTTSDTTDSDYDGSMIIPSDSSSITNSPAVSINHNYDLNPNYSNSLISSDTDHSLTDQISQITQEALTTHENKLDNSESTIFDTCDNVILILGNILHPDGTPHDWMIQRVEESVKLLNKYNLDLSKTIFIPSGSDVSNQKYTYDINKYNGLYTNYPHPSESKVMGNLLHNKYNIPLNNIILESQARTTLENICFCFELLYINQVNKLKNFFIVSSDWHIKRAEINFELLYTKEKEIKNLRKTEGNIVIKAYEVLKWFECDNIRFIGAKSNAPKERFERDIELRNAKWVKPQAKEYSDFIWKWRDDQENEKNNNGIDSNSEEEKELEGLNEKEVMEVFAFSTAIEHLYLRLEGAKNGLNVKQLEKYACHSDD